MTERQRVVKTGPRRARLEPAPGTDPSPEAPTANDDGPRRPERAGDERYLRDVPPHW